jgi:dipeptidyl aminopeptidase/acylaminoacyl peptidase
VATAGLYPDPDGYTIALDGAVARSVAATDTLVYDDVSAGEHSISVDGLSPDCSVEGGTPSPVAVIAGATARIAITVRCVVAGRILFGTIEESWGSDLWVVNSDGSGLRRLTNDVSSDHCQRWTPDGRILFVSDREGGGVFTMNADGSDLRHLVAGNVEPCPTWSPDMSMYLYALVEDDETHIYIVNAIGSNPRLLGPTVTENVAWAPDGASLVFVATDGNIYSIKVDGTGLRRLVESGGYPGSLRWSPDGRTIAFSVAPVSGSNQEERDLYFMNPDGTHLRLVGKGFPYAWAPQGDRLLAVNGFPGWTGRTFLADGSDEGAIGPVWDFELSWSPDGRALAFTGPYEPGKITHEEIWVMKPDGSGRTPITNLNVFGVVGPQWGP